MIALLVVMAIPCGTATVHRCAPPVDARIARIINDEATTMTVAARRTLAATITRVAAEYAIDPLLILAIVRIESHFTPHARSTADAMGLMQIRAIVVRDVATAMHLDPQHTQRYLNDAMHNIRIGVHYFASLLIRFHDDIPKALLAYNQGPTSVARIYGHRPAPPIGYAAKVLEVYRRYRDS